MRKILFLAVVLFCASYLSADDVHLNGCKGPGLCTSYPILDGCGWSFDAGVIIEQMRASNTDVCYSQIQTTDGTGTSENPKHHRTMRNITFELEPGLRVGAAYYFDHDKWRTSAQFEWMSARGSHNETLDTGLFYATHKTRIYNEGVSATTGINFRTVESSMDVDYYLLDVTLSRGSFISGNFSFESFAGIKASWIDYVFSRKLSNDSDTTILPVTTGWLNVGFVDFWGVGPEFGFNSNYYVCAGWSIFSSSNIAVLLGESRVRDYWGFVTIETLPYSFLAKSTLFVFSPTLRTILGMQYDRDILCDTQHLSMRVGFDIRMYFNQRPFFLRNATALGSDALAGGSLVPTYFDDSYEIVEGGTWGMTGLILDLSYDF